MESIEGFQMSAPQKERAKIIKGHYDFLVEHIGKLDAAIDILTKPFESAVSLFCTISGIRRDTAITILSEIGTDMSQFDSSKRLCRWAGLTPGNNESAGKKKSVRITRAGFYLKPVWIEIESYADLVPGGRDTVRTDRLG
jgi:transposase